MSEISYSHQRSSTFSQVVIAGIMAAQVLHAVPIHNAAAEYHKPLLRDAYSLEGNKATYNSYSTPITGEYTSAAPNGFEQSVGDFYARLLGSQEPLGAEFEKILYENLWDLYES